MPGNEPEDRHNAADNEEDEAKGDADVESHIGAPMLKVAGSASNQLSYAKTRLRTINIPRTTYASVEGF
jgi:hypothetical protein